MRHIGHTKMIKITKEYVNEKLFKDYTDMTNILGIDIIISLNILIPMYTIHPTYLILRFFFSFVDFCGVYQNEKKNRKLIKNYLLLLRIFKLVFAKKIERRWISKKSFFLIRLFFMWNRLILLWFFFQEEFFVGAQRKIMFEQFYLYLSCWFNEWYYIYL